MSDWYLGTKACGCSVACIAIEGRDPDDKEWRREVARFVADCVKRGMTLEKVTDADCRQRLTDCKCGPAKARPAHQEEMAL